MSSNEDLLRFIASSFRSVWSLELLLLLKRDQRHWTQEELLTALRASELVVAQALDSLVVAGLAATEEGKAIFMPVSPDVRGLVEQTEELYSVKPDLVRRTIVSSANSGMVAFADAFRLRRD